MEPQKPMPIMRYMYTVEHIVQQQKCGSHSLLS